MDTLHVALGDRSYPIYIDSGFPSSHLMSASIAGNQVMVVTNETVAPLYLAELLSLLPALKVDHVILPDGEQYKTIATVNQIFDQLLAKQHNRSTTLIALGGGVVGDMVGFAAACYQRGVDFIQIPTTLLAQVDSSVGGKTGVNHPLGKNMIGAFHQPRAVFINVATLKTLAKKELAAGLAEVIKYGLIRDSQFLQWIEGQLNHILQLENSATTRAIRRSCELKAEIVASDEREQGVRAILNLGHTFGHAIEACTGYKEWLHGEGVAVGMLMAADLSARLDYLQQADVGRLKELLLAAALPVKPPAKMAPADFMAYMAVDKKVLDGKIRLVLMQAIGEAFVTDQYSPALLAETLDLFCQS